MKLLIAGTPKTGNVWLENLLSHLYELPIVDMSGTSLTEIPPRRLSEARFVAHQHYSCSPELLAWGRQEDVRFLTLLRHPGDVFVSFYYYLNTFSPILEAQGWSRSRSARALVGERIDSPQVLHFLESHFLPVILQKSLGWLLSGEALCVRYEDLRQEGFATLESLTDQIQPVPRERIELALQRSRIEVMREKDGFLKLHCRNGGTGQWQHELQEAHFEVFRKSWADQLALLGYGFG